jgi:transposase InsO family protein
MQQIYLQSSFRPGYNRLMKYISNIAHMSEKDREVISQRVKIIEFYEEFGKEATFQAFSISRSTVMLWKQKLKKNGFRLSALKLGSRAPKSPRLKRKVSQEIIDFVYDYRVNHPGVSKETIKPHLDLYCQENQFTLVSESTIGRIISQLKEKGLIPFRNTKLSYYARLDKFFTKKAKSPREKKLRIKNYRPYIAGDLVQIDAITVFVDGVKRYLLTGIDIFTRFAFAYSCETLSSRSATEFLKKFMTVTPFAIKAIQTDNGHEFHKYFADYADKNQITHFWSYPHHPQSNAYVERFNGLIQDQFVSWHLKDLSDSKKFNLDLMNYLLWYNTEKPHSRIGKIPPLRYYLNSLNLTNQKSNMLWTETGY